MLPILGSGITKTNIELKSLDLSQFLDLRSLLSNYCSIKIFIMKDLLAWLKTLCLRPYPTWVANSFFLYQGRLFKNCSTKPNNERTKYFCEKSDRANNRILHINTIFYKSKTMYEFKIYRLD